MAGPVRLSLTDPLPLTFSGQLLDISEGGFRAAHGCRDIHAGMEIVFSHAAASGTARVAWNRVNGDAVETGFVLSKTTKPDGASPGREARRQR